MPDWLKAVMYMAAGVGITVIGVLFWRHAERVAESFRRTGSMLFGDKTARPVYTARNSRWASGGWIILGLVILVSGIVLLIRSR